MVAILLVSLLHVKLALKEVPRGTVDSVHTRSVTHAITLNFART